VTWINKKIGNEKSKSMIVPCLFLTILVCYPGCGEQEKPPFFTAQVIDLWNETNVVENFKVLYWWQERGETPFLKPYEYHAKELIVEIMVPSGGDSRRVNITTRRIPFQDIEKFQFIRGELENQIHITLKTGEELTATDRFPQVLKKEKDTGFADYTVFVEGTISGDNKREAFKQELKKIKLIEFINVVTQ
jgi:hypothetical protein